MKVFVWDKYSVLTAVLVVALALSALPLSRRSAEVSSAARDLPIYSVERQDNKIAVTFNCAWGDEDIPNILSALRERDIKCTFFIVGDWAKKFPDSLRNIAADGHEIGYHSMNHKSYADMTDAEIASDIAACDEAIGALVGQNAALIRAPSGDYDTEAVLAVRGEGRQLIQWDVDSLDWKNLSKDQMKKRVLDRVGCGSIILFHSGTANTAASIGEILDDLSGAGYAFTTVGDLIYTGDYYIDNTGRQFQNQ